MEYNIDIDIDIDIDIITPLYIKEKNFVNYDNFYLFCNNIKNFIIANLHNYINQIPLFLYIDDFNLTEEDINLLFILNKSMKLITLNMFVEKQNEFHIYTKLNLSYYDDDRVNIKIYSKKYICAFIKNNEIYNLQSKIKKYNLNYLNKYKLKLLFKNDIQNSKVETDNVYNTYDYNKYYYSIIDNYDDDIQNLNNNINNYEDILSIYVYSKKNYKTVKNIDNIDDNLSNYFKDCLKTDIKNNYTEILLYENAFETSTDLVKLLHSFIM